MNYKRMWEKLKEEVQEGKDVPFCRGWIFAVIHRIEEEAGK